MVIFFKGNVFQARTTVKCLLADIFQLAVLGYFDIRQASTPFKCILTHGFNTCRNINAENAFAAVKCTFTNSGYRFFDLDRLNIRAVIKDFIGNRRSTKNYSFDRGMIPKSSRVTNFFRRIIIHGSQIATLVKDFLTDAANGSGNCDLRQARTGRKCKRFNRKNGIGYMNISYRRASHKCLFANRGNDISVNFCGNIYIRICTGTDSDNGARSIVTVYGIFQAYGLSGCGQYIRFIIIRTILACVKSISVLGFRRWYYGCFVLVSSRLFCISCIIAA